MGVIRELPTSVINQIAAGEVVERPASVVKELLENAIDAGATRIELSVERGGKDLIRIADNGKGMEPEDLTLAFLPHATSKLREAEDLYRISTLGFRGEALAAIAEVSKVTCQSRTANSTTGWEITINNGVKSKPRECAGPVGTVMEVRHLFGNIPVRRGYLRSDSTEAAHVAEMFTRLALAHPSVHFVFRSAGKAVHNLASGMSLRDRIAAFFGRELADSLLWVEGSVDDIHLSGYVSHPSHSRADAKHQYLFIGGRYVRDKALTHAMNEAYRGLLMVGRVPIAFLNLEIPPDLVDVNVHPSKIEVRFREANLIYSHVLGTIRKTFLASDLHSKLQAPAEAKLDDSGIVAKPGPSFSSIAANAAISANASDSPSWLLTPSPKTSAPSLFESPSESSANRQAVASWFAPGGAGSFQPYPKPGYAGGPVGPTLPAPSYASPSSSSSSQPGDPPRVWDPQFDETGGDPSSSSSSVSSPSSSKPVLEPTIRALQVHDSYLIVETADGMVVIDQHALHERILFEEFKARLESGGVEAQRLLVPEVVDLTTADAALALEHQELLAKLGLEIAAFGGDSIAIHSFPPMLRHATPDGLLRDLVDHLASKPLRPTADGVMIDVLNMMACKAAVKAGQKLSSEEIAALLERRELAHDAHHCPHGRPTALIFTKSELEKQFGRI